MISAGMIKNGQLTVYRFYCEKCGHLVLEPHDQDYVAMFDRRRPLCNDCRKKDKRYADKDDV